MNFFPLFISLCVQRPLSLFSTTPCCKHEGVRKCSWGCTWRTGDTWPTRPFAVVWGAVSRVQHLVVLNVIYRTFNVSPQPSHQNKFWRCTFLQTTIMLNLYVSYVAEILKPFISMHFSFMFWQQWYTWLPVSLGTKTTWLGLEKHNFFFFFRYQVWSLWLKNTCFCWSWTVVCCYLLLLAHIDVNWTTTHI